MRNSFFLTTGILFVLLTAVFYAIQSYGFHFVALEVGNTLMASLCLISYFIVKRQIDNRPAAFVRGVYSASFLKLMVCMISVLVYVLLNRSHIHKPSVFVLFGIYIAYTVIETMLLSKLAKGGQS